MAACLMLLISNSVIPANCKNLEGFDETDEDEFVEEQIPVESEGWKQQQRQPGSAAGKFTPTSEENNELEEKEVKISSKKNVAGDQSGSSDPVNEKEAQTTYAGEEWDEDEFEGLPGSPPSADFPSSARNQAKPSAKQQQQQRQGSPAGGSAPTTGKSKPPPAAPVRRKLKSLKPQDLIVEGILVLFLAVFGINFFVGRQTNESLALAWAEQFASPGGILYKNFALLGTGMAIKNTTKDTATGGDEAEGSSSSEGQRVGGEDDGALLIKDGQNVFKLYASGRRFCESLLVLLQLRNRHDLITLLWETVMGNRDNLEAEVLMDEDAMPPLVFAIVRKQAVKGFLKDNDDCRDFASVIDTSALRSKWGASDLAVISESRELANELLSDVIVEQVSGGVAGRRLPFGFACNLMSCCRCSPHCTLSGLNWCEVATCSHMCIA